METSVARPQNSNKPKLLDQVRAIIRLKHYSIRTEQAYVDWIRRFILFHQKRHPKEMNVEEVRGFLSHLANERNVSSSTQNQALAALLFLYQEVLKQPLAWIDGVDRAKRGARLPTVFTKEEVEAILSRLESRARLMGQLLYGCGLRLMEVCRLRIKDIDFGYLQIVVRNGKGDKDQG